MLEVKGIDIGNSQPFEGLKLISELLDFDGEPMLMHHTDIMGHDWVSYWVDFDKTGKRWLYGKVTKEELYFYLIGNKSLRQVFEEIKSDYIFLIDYDVNEQYSSGLMLNSYAIPEKYFAGNNSYYEYGLTDFYQTYLYKYDYIEKLRQCSYKFIVEPSNGLHGNTVSAKDAAAVLFGATKSMEGYIDVTGFNVFKHKDERSKVNKKINKYKQSLSPRIAQNAFHSFEVWLSMDVFTLHLTDKEEISWKSNLIENYKNDVLNVDISSEEDARIIEQKYTPEERKKIFEPLIKIYDNEDIAVTLTDYKSTFVRELKKKPLSTEFKNIVVPKPTKEQEQVEAEVQETIVALIVKMRDGENIGNLRIKDLRANLLFSETQPDLAYTITAPIECDGITYKLKKPIKCHYLIKAKNIQELYNADLEISAEGVEYEQVVGLFLEGLRSLIREYIKGKEIGRIDARFTELEKYIDI
jgi:hypothetical protein